MTERTMTLVEAGNLLTTLDKQSLEETLIITNDAQPLLALMPYPLYCALRANVTSLQNVLEVMASGIQSEIPRTPRPEKSASSEEKGTS